MLVLTLAVGQSLQVGGWIVTVVAICGTTVELRLERSKEEGPIAGHRE